MQQSNVNNAHWQQQVQRRHPIQQLRPNAHQCMSACASMSISPPEYCTAISYIRLISEDALQLEH
ncbi:unnamed protein product [Ceratitis capitata]|uniref:(Mediterranean fruit fly) hypothetical protein n=1 Tax=Ceratitis capitata TaxID=7213 RepID=A0A811U0F8_CERCA|nr:unnamed protein product [Ceratitis capitata]